MLRSHRRRPGNGIHLSSPAEKPDVAVPAGLADLTTEEQRLSQEIDNFKGALAKLGEEYLRLQDQRVAARRRGEMKLAEKVVGEMQDILRRMAAIQHCVPRLEKQREQLGWRMDAEKRRQDETSGT